MARPSLARRLGAATLFTTLALSVAACGGDDGSATDAGSSASEESEQPESEESAESEGSSGEVPELSAEEFYPAVMGALEDAETFAFSTTTTGAGAENAVSGVMRWAEDGLEMKASSTGAQAFDMIVSDKVMYIESSLVGSPDGKKWIKVDLSDPNSLFGQLGKTLDPTTMFKAMSSPKELEVLGSEEIAGVETNQYRVVMDTAEFTKALDMPQEMLGSMPDEIATLMWVDADNRPHKFTQEIEIPGPGGKPVATRVEGTYSDFGVDVDIEVPPASEVGTMPGMS
ncbi:hypothetical protein [Nocardioides piscis]|uniref:LppX_LprAFG lipoprotein n=1 Tax=Nocardioides piscis TaxID=2714938 RepID=A0A6G7YC96_9ACTN|nr:hypothetical protein [Nocardioides piscis]QIK74442.1 hypothetical protein G7071_02285 [Nocardioides piscis]